MKVIRPSCREKPRAADDKEPGSGCAAPPTFFCFFLQQFFIGLLLRPLFLPLCFAMTFSFGRFFIQG